MAIFGEPYFYFALQRLNKITNLVGNTMITHDKDLSDWQSSTWGLYDRECLTWRLLATIVHTQAASGDSPFPIMMDILKRAEKPITVLSRNEIFTGNMAKDPLTVLDFVGSLDRLMIQGSNYWTDAMDLSKSNNIFAPDVSELQEKKIQAFEADCRVWLERFQDSDIVTDLKVPY
ncbi:MAG: hypothetical protein Q9218_004266 [Villophora microphyllina]